MIFGLPWTIVFGFGSLLLGLAGVWMALLGFRDAETQQGAFSKRRQAAFGHWKINRMLVRFNSWADLISMIAGGPLLIGVGIWLMLR